MGLGNSVLSPLWGKAEPFLAICLYWNSCVKRFTCRQSQP